MLYPDGLTAILDPEMRRRERLVFGPGGREGGTGLR